MPRSLQGLSADLRFAARRLLATPLFTIFAVLSLALGVGVTTAVYSVVDSIFLKDPWMLLVVPIPLILAAFCACYVPAQRAARLDPNVALRHQ